MPIFGSDMPPLVGTAAVGDVEDTKTFYNDNALILRTGTLALTGNANVGDVEDTKTFYKDDLKTRLTGTLALTGDAVVGDVRLAKTFYKDDLKTRLTGTAIVVHDVNGEDVSLQSANGSYTIYFEVSGNIPIGGDVVILAKSITLDQASEVEACFGGAAKFAVAGNRCKLQFFIDGIQQSESGYLDNQHRLFYSGANKPCSSGARNIYVNAHNYGDAAWAVHHTMIVFGGATKI